MKTWNETLHYYLVMKCSINKYESKLRLKNNLFVESCDYLNFAVPAGVLGTWRGLLFRGPRVRCTGFEPERCLPTEAMFAFRA
jgi:hypothetical protein